MGAQIEKTALLTNTDGSIYHLSLLPEELASTVILVGDPGRVPHISRYFDRIDVKKSHREFVTHTGWYQDHRLSVVSTGIGSGCVDIVMNELDALANVDFKTRMVKESIKKLTFLRLGTCGAIHPSITPGEMIVSRYAIGLDGVFHAYEKDEELELHALRDVIQSHIPDHLKHSLYIGSGTSTMIDHLSSLGHVGLTLTCPSFFGGQCRSLRLPLRAPFMIESLETVNFNNDTFLNLEMETALIFAIGRALGHNVASLCTAISNRVTQEVLSDMPKAIDTMIQASLAQLVNFLKLKQFTVDTEYPVQ